MYSEGKDLFPLLLNDLYYHMEGELGGRQITQGPFQELSHFVLESEPFQWTVGKNEDDGWLTVNFNSMFDISHVQAELGLELWEHSGWKESIEVAERMLRYMKDANLIMSLSVSKNYALQSLVAILSMQNGNVSFWFLSTRA